MPVIQASGFRNSFEIQRPWPGIFPSLSILCMRDSGHKRGSKSVRSGLFLGSETDHLTFDIVLNDYQLHRVARRRIGPRRAGCSARSVASGYPHEVRFFQTGKTSAMCGTLDVRDQVTGFVHGHLLAAYSYNLKSSEKRILFDAPTRRANIQF